MGETVHFFPTSQKKVPLPRPSPSFKRVKKKNLVCGFESGGQIDAVAEARVADAVFAPKVPNKHAVRIDADAETENASPHQFRAPNRLAFLLLLPTMHIAETEVKRTGFLEGLPQPTRHTNASTWFASPGQPHMLPLRALRLGEERSTWP